MSAFTQFRRGGLLLGILVLVAGCNRHGTPVERGIREQVLYRSLSADLTDLDPQLVTGLPGVNVASALFEGLVAEDPVDLHPVPGVAERWDVSPEGTTYTFHLRSNARWSNGDPLTAEDFVASVHRELSPELGASSVSMLFVLKNAGAFAKDHEGKVRFEDVGIKADDAHTLRLTLEHPVASLLSQLCQPAWFPVPTRVIASCGPLAGKNNPWTRPEHFVGNGPFTLTGWEHNRLILVEKSPNYWDAAHVRLHAIRFIPSASVDAEERAFRGGQLHITEALPIARIDAYRQANDPALQISPFLDTYFYRINVTKPVLNDVRVRRALSLAIDRTALVQSVLRGQQQPARSFTPPGCDPTYDPPAAASDDPEAARKLLAEAGYPGGKGLPPIELLINISGNHQLIAEAVQAMWRRELGVDVHIVTMEQTAALAQRSLMAYQILRSDWAADYANDPLAFLNVFTSESSDNHTGWKSPAYDALLAHAEREIDGARRNDDLKRAESMLLEQAPLIPLYHLTTIRLVHRSVHGWYPTLLDHHPYKAIWLE
ncbi:MAG TPA: peptide ABC transporter substrate-binding protein [Candidatus Didemnitutus sp.]|nr:peptide ABC transporter substrate-binding protein [Candidatus Didemnitutus sp.]